MRRHDMTRYAWHDMTWHDMIWHDAKMDKGWCTGHLFVLRTTSRGTQEPPQCSPVVSHLPGTGPTNQCTKNLSFEYGLLSQRKNMCLNFELPNIPWIILNYPETSIHHYPSIKKKENNDFLHIKTVKTPKSCLLGGLVDLLGKPVQELMQSTDCWAAPITGILRYVLPAPCGI